jgi:hypothetical protein
MSSRRFLWAACSCIIVLGLWLSMGVVLYMLVIAHKECCALCRVFGSQRIQNEHAARRKVYIQYKENCNDTSGQDGKNTCKRDKCTIRREYLLWTLRLNIFESYVYVNIYASVHTHTYTPVALKWLTVEFCRDIDRWSTVTWSISSSHIALPCSNFSTSS